MTYMLEIKTDYEDKELTSDNEDKILEAATKEIIAFLRSDSASSLKLEFSAGVAVEVSQE